MAASVMTKASDRVQANDRQRSDVGLEQYGITQASSVYWNLTAPELYEEVARYAEELTDLSQEENARLMRAALDKVREELGRESPLVIGGERIREGRAAQVEAATRAADGAAEVFRDDVNEEFSPERLDALRDHMLAYMAVLAAVEETPTLERSSMDGSGRGRFNKVSAPNPDPCAPAQASSGIEGEGGERKFIIFDPIIDPAIFHKRAEWRLWREKILFFFELALLCGVCSVGVIIIFSGYSPILKISTLTALGGLTRIALRHLTKDWLAF
jgi:hypothetical protein